MRAARLKALSLWAAVSLVAGCEGPSGQPPSQESKLVTATSLSSHYVEVLFSEPVVDRADTVQDYWIVAETGARLRVRAVDFAPDFRSAVLTTDPQKPVGYTVTVFGLAPRPSTDGGSTTGGGGTSTTFTGTIDPEFYLATAIAVSNTSVLLTFSDALSAESAQLAANYRIVAADGSTPATDVGDVDITSATLGADGITVLLTTSPQKDIEYLAIATNLRSRNTSKLIDPTLNTARFFGMLVADTVAPRVVSAVATGASAVTVQFSEPVSAAAGDGSSYLVTKEDSSAPGPEVLVVGAQLNGFTTQATLDTTPLTAGVVYRVTVTGVEDLRRNKIEDGGANSATFLFSGSPGTSDLGLPRVVGAISTSNTTVELQYSKPMADSAVAASNYSIVQEYQQPEAGVLLVSAAEFVGADRTRVKLTTRSQSELTYRLTAVNVTDLAGNPIAAKQIVLGVLVDPASATFPGTPASGIPVDTDGDGLPDSQEQRGWVVTVKLANGAVVARDVTSDPDNADTDQDGLNDAVEKNLGTDPRNPDTDADQLGDNEEFNVIFSDPTVQDSDGDGISDTLEVEFFKTNAIDADSDGDGLADGAELFSQVRDPRIADIPQQAFVVGDVRLQLDERYTYTNGSGQTVTQQSSTATNLQTDKQTIHGSGSSLTGNFVAGIEDCQSDCKVDDVSAIFESLFLRSKLEASIQKVTQSNDQSMTDAQQAYQTSLQKGSQLDATSTVVRDVTGARMDVAITLQNTSDVAFTLSNLELTVTTTDLANPSLLLPVATLVPSAGQYTLPPGSARGPILFSNSQIYPSLVQDLMRSPRPLIFKVSSFDLVTADGRNFAFGYQSIRERTAGLALDFGDGRVHNYQVSAAGVLDRPRDELRCANFGDHPHATCATDADCGTSTPCEGGQIVGGFAGYSGTGKQVGLPLDFVLQDVLHLRRETPQQILAGSDGVADTTAAGDDVQVAASGTTGLDPAAVVIAPGKNGVLDTVPAAGDLNPTEPDGILCGDDGVVQSVAQGDDVQLVPVGTRGLPTYTVVIAAGVDGLLQTAPAGDDEADVVTGYEVSRSCGADTPIAVLAGPNGTADTAVTNGTCLLAYAPHVYGEPCSLNADCGSESGTGNTGVCGSDVQQVPVGTSGLIQDAPVVVPGPLAFLASIPGGDDVYLAPGAPCTTDADCRRWDGNALTGGTCSGPQIPVRVENLRRGQFRRIWAVVLEDQTQFQTDFGQIRVRPSEILGLAFIQDLDRDGLTAEAEAIYGSSDFKQDTDGDGLGDFAETRIGWTVGVVGQPLRTAYSDPTRKDSDRDGLTDPEEQDFRPLHCQCASALPLPVGGNNGSPCRSDGDCGSGTCLDAAAWTVASYLAGTPCPPCSQDPTRYATDPRLADSDGDGVSDFDEVFGFLTGAGIANPSNGPTIANPADGVIIAGTDLMAQSVACPLNHCLEDAAKHCLSAGDCDSRQCVHPVACDDIQAVEPSTGVHDPRTVVVAIGAYDSAMRQLTPTSLPSPASSEDVLLTSGDRVASSHAFGDDVPLVGLSAPVLQLVGTSPVIPVCADGGRFDYVAGAYVPRRFLMCGIIKPGVDGQLESQVGGDDVIVPPGSGQRREFTDPLNPDTDLDLVGDGYERTLGSSPNDPGDTGLAGDRDQDGLTDALERSGWTVNAYNVNGALQSRLASSNPNVADTDLDGIPDYAEAHMPCFADPTSECATDPTSADTDGDGLSDLDELSDAQLTLLARYASFFPGYELDANASHKYGTDPTRADTDGDLLSDKFELRDGWLVLAANGLVRQVYSSPTLRDSDADGQTDYQELHHTCFGASGTCPTDPTSADSDADGRLDGREATLGTDPLTPDLSVTVTFRQIDVDKIMDSSGADGADFGWWFVLRAPGAAPQLISQADNGHSPGYEHFVLAPPATDDGTGHCASNCTCRFLKLDTDTNPNSTTPPGAIGYGDHDSIHLTNSSVTFSLRQGQSFTIEGLVAEMDAASIDCGVAPNYIPSSFNSECYSRFVDTYNYSDFATSGQGQTMAVNPTQGGAIGGDTCTWTVVEEITVQ